MLEENERCIPIQQRLLIYFPENNRLVEQWGDICTSLFFYFWYDILRQFHRPDLLSNLSRTYIELTEKRLDLGFTEAQIENLSTEKNKTTYFSDFRFLRSGLINKTQALMQDVVRSDMIGY